MPSGVPRMASKGRAASWMYNEEDVDSDVAAVCFGGEEKVGFGEAEVGVDEGAGFEFKGAPVDACGDFRRESVDEEGGGCGWIGEAGAEETVVGVEGVLVGHGGARMIGGGYAAASKNAEKVCFEGWPHGGLMWLAMVLLTRLRVTRWGRLGMVRVCAGC